MNSAKPLAISRRASAVRLPTAHCPLPTFVPILQFAICNLQFAIDLARPTMLRMVPVAALQASDTRLLIGHFTFMAVSPGSHSRRMRVTHRYQFLAWRRVSAPYGRPGCVTAPCKAPCETNLALFDYKFSVISFQSFCSMPLSSVFILHPSSFILSHFPPVSFVISAIRGMKMATTIKPTIPPRMMIKSGSIKLMRLSVKTATSSS